MSGDWQVPDDLAERVRDSNYVEAWQLEIERTAQTRAIVTDLIAELRACQLPPRATEAADRAEKRLREVQGE